MVVPLVLIVDDEPGLLTLFASLVERLDCEAVVANSGLNAVGVLDQVTPDLMVLDLAMPQFSGVDVLRYARSLPRLANMRVIVLTARPNLLPAVEAIGIDCWLTKPITPNDFMASVIRQLDGN